jgi:hypothetical protein
MIYYLDDWSICYLCAHRLADHDETEEDLPCLLCSCPNFIST